MPATQTPQNTPFLMNPYGVSSSNNDGPQVVPPIEVANPPQPAYPSQ
jgi:hypothetical protein